MKRIYFLLSGTSFALRLQPICKKFLTKRENSLKYLQLTANRRGVRTRNVGVWGLIVSFLILVSLNLVYAEIGAEWNPTGNPIGGGPGYSDSIRHQDADYVVSTKSELLSALSSAGNGDLIYVADSAEIDMGNTQQVAIPTGVTLGSGRGRTLNDTISWGALIYTDEHDRAITLLKTSGSNIRVTGLRFRGSDPEIGDRMNGGVYNRFLTGIKLQHNNAEIDNCEIWGWNYTGIYIGSTISDNLPAYIHHNYIHHCRGQSLGYGICCSDVSSALIEACLFDYCRHYIASDGDINQSYEAQWNLCLDHGNYHGVDRHGTPHEGGDAGKLTLVHNNTCRNTAYTIDYPYCYAVNIRGLPRDTARINNNWFWQPDSASAIKLYTNTNCTVYDNHYGITPPMGVSEKLPVAVISVDTDSGGVPLSVSFNGTNSYDNDGVISWYEWADGDGNTVRDSLMNYIYNDIGIYMAELTVHDNYGNIDREIIPITAVPTIDNQFLSLWVKDSYRDNLNGYFSIQVFIDSHTIWTQDVVGDSGWIHIVKNVTEEISGKDSITITLKVCCDQTETVEFAELIVYFDDVALFWGDVKNGDFEGDDTNDWTYSYGGTGFYSWGSYISEEVRSGLRAYYIRTAPNTTCYGGAWAKIVQKVATTTGIGIEDEGSLLAKSYYLLISPNPSMTGSNISYQLSAKSDVTMKIYDISGRLVKTLVDERKGAGYYTINWDGYDEKGNKVPNGVYFYRFQAEPVGNGGSYTATRKVVVIKN